MGLVTLVVLEIVLGIDNLIFIAILADKLPARERNHARIVGLTLALVMRLLMLTALSWMVKLTTPWFTIWDIPFSGRDIILILGGFFLLYKSTTELHERVDGKIHLRAKERIVPSFAVVVAQIVVLDAVFSIDSVITAVGMVEHLPVMMIAVIIAMGVMMMASRPLTNFVNAHQTVVVLCLSFLLMIGLALIAEGAGLKIPKGYLYAAIGFSILIEFLNQLAQHNLTKNMEQVPMRERTAEAILRLLGNKTKAEKEFEPEFPEETIALSAFAEEERNMVSGVLTLGERSIHSVMTPRTEVSWINLDDDLDTIQETLRTIPHSVFPVCRGQLDNVIGIARAQDLMDDIHSGRTLENTKSIREPLVMPESAGVLKAMNILKQTRGHLAMVADEYGSIQGILTPIDILEAIAGEFPDEDEQPSAVEEKPGVWVMDGTTNIYYVEQLLETDGLVDEDDDYASLAGLLLERFGTVPHVGQVLEYADFRFEVLEMGGRRIAKVLVTKIEPTPVADERQGKLL
ncbi:TerC family protein [Oxalobacter vibrioformis]|uniref:TerC family protein n=1 Tax=Oxalobacter vibrioformis TaxID=933080 RepID=A0A9E9LZ12_9BURK|nr:TerC family protein [Oxalobacter vibrioformis]WAW11357.1 TerC family protein [Oxalobacter vibrioformis]